MSIWIIDKANMLVACDPLRLYCNTLQDAELKGNEIHGRHPLRNDRNKGSLHLNFFTGKGADFATNQRWSDHVGCIAELFFNSDCKKAAKWIIDIWSKLSITNINIAASKKVIKPTIDTHWQLMRAVHKSVDFPCFRLFNIYYPAYSPNGAWICYLEGRGIAPDGSKISRPITYWRHKLTGKYAWRLKGPVKPYPLFNLDRLAENSTAAVIVVEGPKCTFAYQQYLDSIGYGNTHVVVSWPFGASNWKNADWRPLFGRKVILWPDNDEPGREAMKGIANLLYGNCMSIEMVRVLIDKPKGWDAADAIEEGLLHG